MDYFEFEYDNAAMAQIAPPADMDSRIRLQVRRGTTPTDLDVTLRQWLQTYQNHWAKNPTG